MDQNNYNLVKILKENGVVVMPTDTIYGLVGKAESPFVVNRIYSIRKRAPDKPCIILIGEIKELEKFSINLSAEQKKEIQKYWPGPVSIIFDCLSDKLKYLHRETKTLAFRLPKDEGLQNLLKKTGPLIVPSANVEGLPPAKNIFEAKKYFDDSVDLYIDGGEISSNPSRVIKLNNDGTIIVFRG